MPKNRLAGETSPYLLQHAENPVDWYPWGSEALDRARNENKPIFLSVGYSSCHWCHVMAHESFENEDVASFMNSNFVNIKVDREERPDIDDIYQKACQMATGQGGWPLSVFLTPDQKPFHVGTYYPPLDSHGRPGFGSVCRQLAQSWAERQGDVDSRADDFVRALSKADGAPLSEAALRAPESDTRRGGPGFDESTMDEAAVNLYNNGDYTYGGFGSAPKFPNAACVSFLFRYAASTGHESFAKFALKTLDRMARGGIFDQIGGGFHRYSTDARWLVPHFEKMLYDNALIPVNYAEAYQLTKKEFYLDVMKKTLDFVLREMASPLGGFYSAYDADSEGVEGRYYTWAKREVLEVLGAGTRDADLFCLYYDVTDGGNWEGSTILCNNIALSTAAFKVGVPEGDARASLERSAAALLAARRAGRVPPGLDQKILASWNALFVSALAKGYRVSGDSTYLDAAKRCLSFIQSEMFCDGRLLRTYKDGRARIDGYLEDYAYLACALLDVFEAEPDAEYLESAVRMGRVILSEFWDEETSGFFMTGRMHESLIIRPQSRYDLSMPSGNSVAVHALLRLYHLTGERPFLDACSASVRSQAPACAENPFAFGYMLNVMSAMLAGSREITLLNTPADPGMCRMVLSSYLPNSIVVEIRSREQLDGVLTYPFFAGKAFDEGRASAYVCKDSVCSLPIHDADRLREALGLDPSEV